MAALHEMLEHELGQLRFWVNRVDLFADWQGWTLTLDDAHRFVCRADARRTYEVGGDLTGFEFGTRKTKTFSGPPLRQDGRRRRQGHRLVARSLGRTLRARTARAPTRVRVRAPGTRRVRPQHAGPGPRRRRRPVGLRHRGMADLSLPHRRPDPFPLAPRSRVAAGPAGHARTPGRRPRAAAPGPAVDLHREAAPGPHRLPRLPGRPHRHRWHRGHARARSGIICTPTRSSATPPSQIGWPAAAASWSCGEHGRARLRAGGGCAGADRVAHGERNEDKQDKVEQEDSDVDGGLLPGVDRGTGGGGLLDRRAS